MIFIVAENYDGAKVHTFETTEEAEEFYVNFLRTYEKYGGEILLAVEGAVLIPKTVSVINKVKLEKGDK